MFKIGVIGCGFVGGAVTAGFSLKAEVKIYDKYKPGFDTLADTCGQDILFLCVPTPMRLSDGKPELSFIMDALVAITETTKETKTIVIKSTVLPGTNRELQVAFPQFNFISNPEFLTARSARLDFINASRIVIGGPDTPARLAVNNLYREIFLHTPIYMCSWEEAELCKYMANCYFALKVSFLNEMYAICKDLNIDYNYIKLLWLADGRIGNSHHEVPGHDGDFGFGGTCFPKDIAAFTTWSRENGYPIETLEAAKAVNDRVRQKKDWEVFNDTK